MDASVAGVGDIEALLPYARSDVARVPTECRDRDVAKKGEVAGGVDVDLVDVPLSQHVQFLVQQRHAADVPGFRKRVNDLRTCNSNTDMAVR